MNLLLLGCTGFIGTELVPKLLKAGHHLTIVSRKNQKDLKASFKNQKIKFIKTDPSLSESWQEEKVRNTLKSSEGIINLVGEPIAEKRWTQKHCQEIEKSRLNTTKYLVEVMNEINTPCKVLINASAIGFYGTSANQIFSETSNSGDDFLAKVCNQWEQNASQKPQKTRLVIIRTGIVIEKDGGALGKMLPIFKAGFGGPIGDGMQWMSWIHRTDLCKMIEIALINKNWSGVFNGVSPRPVQMKEFCKVLSNVLNRPNFIPLPGTVLKLLLGDGAKVVLEGQKVEPLKLLKLGFKFTYNDLKTALLAIKDT